MIKLHQLHCLTRHFQMLKSICVINPHRYLYFTSYSSLLTTHSQHIHSIRTHRLASPCITTPRYLCIYILPHISLLSQLAPFKISSSCNNCCTINQPTLAADKTSYIQDHYQPQIFPRVCMRINFNCCLAAAYVGCPIHAFQRIAQNLSEPLMIPFFLSFCLLIHLFRRCFPCR
ncbi:hypothetical protein CPB84DRAFT_608679 [Gymnopilus junonius]|uniref:Uncharacterized protein n=1 Tax=Gymnopilus junonius TaxID=109634 RepID=A0A9P5NAC7_GYMJU|nr:hypothetical protein CPB84DRAFT_608679 [Gymnopilus junonius]